MHQGFSTWKSYLLSKQELDPIFPLIPIFTYKNRGFKTLVYLEVRQSELRFGQLRSLSRPRALYSRPCYYLHQVKKMDELLIK